MCADVLLDDPAVTVCVGVNFMEKTIALRNTDITFSIWDLGGQQEYLHMLPLVCNDAVALLFMFDLSRKSTLTSVKNWYKQARLLNKVRHTQARHPRHHTGNMQMQSQWCMHGWHRLWRSLRKLRR